jgi:hypothetical protein
MMLAKPDDPDVAQHDEFVVTADFLEGAFEIGARVGVVAGERLAL